MPWRQGNIAFVGEWTATDVAERILAQTVAHFAQRGDERAVALLIDVRLLTCRVTSEHSRRGWNKDVECWVDSLFLAAVLEVEDHLIPRFTVRSGLGSQRRSATSPIAKTSWT